MNVDQIVVEQKSEPDQNDSQHSDYGIDVDEQLENEEFKTKHIYGFEWKLLENKQFPAINSKMKEMEILFADSYGQPD